MDEEEVHMPNLCDERIPLRHRSRSRSRVYDVERTNKSRSMSDDCGMSQKERERSRTNSIVLHSTLRPRGPARFNVCESNEEYRAGDEHERRSATYHRRTPSPIDDEYEQRLRERLIRDMRYRSGEQERHSRYHFTDRMTGSYERDDEHERRHLMTPRHLSKNCQNDELEQRSDINCIRSSRFKSMQKYRDDNDENRCSNHSSYDQCPPSNSFRNKNKDHTFAGHTGASDPSTNMLLQFVEALKGFSKGNSSKFTSVANVVPEFDPMSKNQTIQNWITKVEECSSIYDWDERETIHYSLPKLSGLAKTWYQSLPSVKFTWAEWKDKLCESFPCRENFAELLTEMLAIKAKYGDSLEQYYYEKINLLNRCQITGKKAVDCILYGIDDRALKLGAQSAQFETPEQVLKYLKSVKVGQAKDGNGTTIRGRVDRKPQNATHVASNKAQSSQIKSPIRCFNCGTEGHPSFKCPKPIEKCNNCYKIGHRTATCPSLSSTPENSTHDRNSKNKNDEKQVLKVNLSETEETDKGPGRNSTKDKYVVTVRVNGVPMPCYVDLGSECTLMRLTDAMSLSLNLSNCDLPTMRGLGGNLVQPIGKTTVTIQVQDVSESLDVFIVEDMVLKYPVLLGHSFTELPGILITKTPTHLLFEKMTKHTKLFLTACDEVTIAPGDMKAVSVSSNNKHSGKVYVNGSIRGKANSEFFLLSGEYDLNLGLGQVLIQNVSTNKLTFSKDDLITRALPLNEECYVYNLSTCNETRFDSVNYNDELGEDQVDRLRSLLSEYKDCFSSGLFDLGFTTVAEMQIKLKDSEPVVYRPYRMSYSERDTVQTMVKEMLDANIIRESSSPYASPIVLVKKKTGEKRLCVDYRALNRKTVKDHYPMPRVEDQLDLLAGHKYFITLDLASGY